MEAAVFFSVPTWLLSGEQAWPADDPVSFTLAVSGMAALAAILCHVLPILYGGEATKAEGTSLRILLVGLVGWLITGAIVSAYQLAEIAGRLIIPNFVTNDQSFRVALTVLTLLILGLAVYFGENRTQVLCIALGVIGLFAVITSLFLQKEGLHSLNKHLSDDNGLNDLGSVCKGICLSATPVSFVALQLARQNLSRKVAWISGALGVWLPLSLSAISIASAKIAGARLYWRPSVPIGIQFAFTSLSQLFGTHLGVRYLMAPMLLVPAIFCIVAVKNLVPYLPQKRGLRRGVSAASIALAIVVLPFSSRTDLYFRPWCWSILLCALGLGAWSLIKTIRSSRAQRHRRTQAQA